MNKRLKIMKRMLKARKKDLAKATDKFVNARKRGADEAKSDKLIKEMSAKGKLVAEMVAMIDAANSEHIWYMRPHGK